MICEAPRGFARADPGIISRLAFPLPLGEGQGEGAHAESHADIAPLTRLRADLSQKER